MPENPDVAPAGGRVESRVDSPSQDESSRVESGRVSSVSPDVYERLTLSVRWERGK